jgi:16S rRNA (cytosine967-C5)-methyltransferase
VTAGPAALAVAPRGVTESRAAAAGILADLRAGELLDAAFDRRTLPLDARDRRWTQELVYGTLRRRAWIDAVLGPRVRGGLARLDPDLVDLLRLGVHQLLHMRSVPPYAAIAQTVELAKGRHGVGASKLANAVLRRVDRERDALGVTLPDDPAERLALQHSHPRWLVARWVARFGAEEAARLLAANDAEAPVILRPWGVVREQLEATLEAAGVRAEDAPLVRDSLLVTGHGQLGQLGAYRQGLFFVQDPAATLVVRFAAPPAGARAVDLCAAPGGKTLELARTAAHVVAVEPAPERVARLRENLARLDAANVEVLEADARGVDTAPGDVVLVDAPCTGTGTFRRHPDARWRIKPSDLAVMAARQRELLAAAARLVVPGGLLAYSTCSLEPEENDEVVDWFLAEFPAFREEPPPAGTVPAAAQDGARLRVLPPRTGTDGAFAARLRRVVA